MLELDDPPVEFEVVRQGLVKSDFKPVIFKFGFDVENLVLRIVDRSDIDQGAVSNVRSVDSELS